MTFSNLLSDNLPASVGQFSHLCDRLIVNNKLPRLSEWIHNQSKVVNSNDCCCHNWLILKRWTRTCQSFFVSKFFFSSDNFFLTTFDDSDKIKPDWQEPNLLYQVCRHHISFKLWHFVIIGRPLYFNKFERHTLESVPYCGSSLSGP